MADQQQDSELRELLDGLETDARGYFAKATKAVSEAQDFDTGGRPHREWFWARLPEEIRDEAIRLDRRLVSLMRQIARAVRNTPLASEADQREVMTGTKTMRAALLLREFDSWDTEVLHDEGTVLGVRRAGQSDDQPSPPHVASRTFSDWAHRLQAMLDLVDVMPESGYLQEGGCRKRFDIAPALPLL